MAKKVFYSKELARLVASNADGSLELYYHVTSTLSGKWALLRHGKKRPCKYFLTEKEAIAFGRKYAAEKSAISLVIHDKDSSIKKEIVLDPKKKLAVNGIRK